MRLNTTLVRRTVEYLCGPNDYDKDGYTNDTQYRVLFAPGSTTLSVDVDYDFGYDILLQTVKIDGHRITDDSRLSTRNGGYAVSILDEPLEPDSCEQLDEQNPQLRRLTYDLSEYAVLYDTFVDHLQFELVPSTPRTRLSIEGVKVHKDFMVRTHEGVADSLGMMLPTVDTGKLADLELTRVPLPGHEEIAQTTWEEIWSRLGTSPDDVRARVLNDNGDLQTTGYLESSTVVIE